MGLFVVTDGFFVVTEDDNGLLVGLRVGFLVVVLAIGRRVTVEGAEGAVGVAAVVPFLVYTTSLRL